MPETSYRMGTDHVADKVTGSSDRGSISSSAAGDGDL